MIIGLCFGNEWAVADWAISCTTAPCRRWPSRSRASHRGSSSDSTVKSTAKGRWRPFLPSRSYSRCCPSASWAPASTASSPAGASKSLYRWFDIEWLRPDEDCETFAIVVIVVAVEERLIFCFYLFVWLWNGCRHDRWRLRNWAILKSVPSLERRWHKFIRSMFPSVRSRRGCGTLSANGSKISIRSWKTVILFNFISFALHSITS